MDFDCFDFAKARDMLTAMEAYSARNEYFRNNPLLVEAVIVAAHAERGPLAAAQVYRTLLGVSLTDAAAYLRYIGLVDAKKYHAGG